jgi:type IV secretion system protein VirD4
MGRMDFFESSLAFIAGYGLKAVLVAQSLNQLEKAYGPNNSILDNCHVRVTFGANDDRTARRISDLPGQATERKKVKSFSGSGLFLTHRSEGVQEFPRALLTPAEVMQLPPESGILFVGGRPSARIRKVRCFRDPRSSVRAGLAPPASWGEQQAEFPPATDACGWLASSADAPGDGTALEASTSARSVADTEDGELPL